MDKNYAFLGTGWSFPPSFGNRGGYVEMVSGTEDVAQSMKIITTTQPGERTMRTRFGCDLSGFAFADITAETINRIHDIISHAIGYHERRVTLSNVDIDVDEDDPGILHITVDYIVSSDNSRHNMVFPYYLHEAQQLDF